MVPLIAIKRNVMATQVKNCLFCLHIGSVAVFIGRGREYGARLEILTPLHGWRWRVGR